VAIVVDVGETGVDLSFTGIDAMWCLQQRLRLHFGDIAGARVASWDEIRPGLGWRVAGAYWPGRIATGHYNVADRPGARQFLAVYRDRELLVIETRLERPCRVVVQHPDRVALAERIEAGRAAFGA